MVENMRDTFLSIDLDYFGGPGSREMCTSFINEILGYCSKHKISHTYVHKHHEILEKIINKPNYIYKYNPQKLINIDYHTDIGNGIFDQSTGQIHGVHHSLSEGSWVQRVKWQTNDHYHWCYPTQYSLELGICHADGYEPDPFTDPQYYNWNNATKQLGYGNIDLDRINYVCFCISLDYWNFNDQYNVWHQKFVDTFRSVLHKIMGEDNYLVALKKALQHSDLVLNCGLGKIKDGDFSSIVEISERENVPYSLKASDDLVSYCNKIIKPL